MNPSRIVHVFPAFSTGGPEVRTALLINEMPEFSHTIVSINGDHSGRARLDRPASVRFVTPASYRGLVGLRTLGRALRAEHPDLLVTYGWGGTDAILGARLAGLRAPIHVEDGFLPDEAAGQKTTRLQMRRLAFRFAAVLIVPSRTLQAIATGTWWLPEARVRYFPNGVDTRRFRPASEAERRSARQGIGAADEEIVVGTVGMLRPDKNHDRLLRVLATVSRTHNVRLVIVGDGPCRPALSVAAQALGVAGRVTFAGAVTDPAACYHSFDVFALSSDTEQMPLSVLEAMASALPVVSTDVGDVAGMLAPGTGGATSPRSDDDALARNLSLFCAEAPRRRLAGRENRARAVAQFSVTTMVESYRSLFRGHLGRPRVES